MSDADKDLFQKTQPLLSQCDEELDNRLLQEWEDFEWDVQSPREFDASLEVVESAFKIVSTIMTAAKTNNIQIAHGRIRALLTEANTLPKI